MRHSASRARSGRHSRSPSRARRSSRERRSGTRSASPTRQAQRASAPSPVRHGPQDRELRQAKSELDNASDRLGVINQLQVSLDNQHILFLRQELLSIIEICRHVRSICRDTLHFIGARQIEEGQRTLISYRNEPKIDHLPQVHHDPLRNAQLALIDAAHALSQIVRAHGTTESAERDALRSKLHEIRMICQHVEHVCSDERGRMQAFTISVSVGLHGDCKTEIKVNLDDSVGSIKGKALRLCGKPHNIAERQKYQLVGTDPAYASPLEVNNMALFQNCYPIHGFHYQLVRVLP